ncbi:MAG: hypothetical protein HY822_19290 [Acidobacteria bacterium]|nr:hypothetical protein [Acidobacteriota bacterium]
MNRWVTIAGIALGTLPLWAQDRIVGTRVSTEPAGAQFYVDGKAYLSAQIFLWPKGSKHVLSVEPAVQDFTRAGWRYSFANWSDSTGLLTASTPTIAVTASPEITWIKAATTVTYEVKVLLADCAPGAACNAPGTVSVAGTPFDRSGSLYLSPGSAITLAAFPKPGFVFAGWQLGTGMSDAFVASFILTGPASVQPRFEPAKQVTLLTSPPGLHVLADRQPLLTPVTVDWGQDTRHVLGAPSPQDDSSGRAWVFDSWEHGGGQNSLYTVDRTNVAASLTARFVAGAQAAFTTAPAGLRLKIDGRNNWPSYTFVWGAGTAHEISAPGEQTDAAGRRWVFKGWSNGGPATQQLTVPQDASGIRLNAVYEALNRVTLQSVPAGLALQVDDAECRTPCTVERPGGVMLRVAAAASIPAGDGMRLDFEGWNDGAAAERAFALNEDNRTLVARYRTLYRLAALAEPEGGARIQLEPMSADSYYPQGATVQVAAEPRPGFRFRAWDGDLSGPIRAGALSLSGPKVVRALLDRVPYVADSGVKNAAGETPVVGVAPGSLVAILGASLAAAYQVGPVNPLAQSLANVTVRVEDRILPLVFVSPEQINALLPLDLEPGERKVAIRWEGQPEAGTTFTVVRNAPGLFARVIEGRPWVVAAHEDGKPVSAENPARRGETLSVYGTGFGPYLNRPPEGFAVPAAPAYPLADPVTVLAGETETEALFAGAAPGQIGTVVTRFRVPESAPEASSIDLRVRVNGQDSNTAQLPIQ